MASDRDAAVEERFWAKVSRGDGDACWTWTAAVWGNGYGCFRMEGRPASAHRVSWSFTNGAIPDGAHVLHRCDNRRCVNPAHLFLGTHADNMRDMAAKGRATGWPPSARARIPHGSRVKTSKLTESDVAEIRELMKSGARGTDVARRYGVTHSVIYRIRNGRSWTSAP